MMATDDERREVAERLRSFVTDDSVYADVDACRVLHGIGLYYKDIDRIYFSGFDVARLADLIEPSESGQNRDRNQDTVPKESPAVLKVPECDRDALLELAEDVTEAAAMATAVDASKSAEMLAELLLDIARRIREALGVSDD